MDQYARGLEGGPELDGRLIFAGEHTSGEFARFMNGAVESGNRAAKEILGLRKSELPKPPDLSRLSVIRLA